MVVSGSNLNGVSSGPAGNRLCALRGNSSYSSIFDHKMYLSNISVHSVWFAEECEMKFFETAWCSHTENLYKLKHMSQYCLHQTASPNFPQNPLQRSSKSKSVANNTLNLIQIKSVASADVAGTSLEEPSIVWTALKRIGLAFAAVATTLTPGLCRAEWRFASHVSEGLHVAVDVIVGAVLGLGCPAGTEEVVLAIPSHVGEAVLMVWSLLGKRIWQAGHRIQAASCHLGISIIAIVVILHVAAFLAVCDSLKASNLYWYKAQDSLIRAETIQAT